MKRFKNILFYTEATAESVPHFERAVDLARRNEGRLTLIGGISEPPPIQVANLVLEQLREQLEQFAAPARAAGLSVDIVTFVGTPFLEIIRDVLRHRRDLVMMTAEGGAHPHWRLGSSSLHLMRKCPCPVWVLKPSPHRRFERILAAVDPRDPVHDALNITIMELATSLTVLEQAELHIVHAWTFPHEETLRTRTTIPKAQVDEMVEATRLEHQRRLDALLAKFPLAELRHKVHLIKWPAATAIDHVARMEQVDVIIMGTVCRTGIAGFFIGNTAETVLRDVPCSVLAVKPAGFVSPVKLPDVEASRA